MVGELQHQTGPAMRIVGVMLQQKSRDFVLCVKDRDRLIRKIIRVNQEYNWHCLGSFCDLRKHSVQSLGDS